MRERDRLAKLKQRSAIIRDDEDDDSKKKKSGADRGQARSRGPFARKLLLAGVRLPARLYVLFAVGASIWTGFLVSFVGAVLAVFISIVSAHYLLVTYLEERAAKRQKKVLPHLAPFIDGIASALGTGFNMEGAIEQATCGIPAGLLRTELERVVNGMNRGLTVTEAMQILRHRVAGKEVTSLVVALNLFASMGGTVLEPFRRLARKIRDQQIVMEKANRDLVMVKQAFYIIFALALGAPLALLFVQPDYMVTAFNDWLGRLIIQIALMMIIGALVIFKKMINIKV